MKVKFKKFSSCVRAPQKSIPDCACYSIFAASCVTLESGATTSIETDIGLSFSKNYVARIYPGSGLSLEPITLGGGVVDSDSRGTIRVTSTNL